MVVEVSELAPSNKKSAIRVLHVDDDSFILEISKQIMMDMDCNLDFDSACCVDEALKKLSTGQYDVVISDYEMPQKDGLQFLKELREGKNEIPFVLFTGKGREEVAIKALNLGADGYFNKQGNPETVYGELIHGIRQSVNQNRLSKKLSAEEERFRQLFINTHMAVAIYEAINNGEDFVFKDFNSAAEKIEKIDKAEVLGKRVTHVFSGVKNFGVFEVFKRVWKTGKAEYFPAAIYQDNRDTGSWRENWIIKLPNDNIAAIYNDITERKKNDLEIKQKNEMLEKVSESIDSGLALIDKDYSVVWANKHLMDLGVAPNKKCYQTFNSSKTVCPDCGAKKVFEQNVSLDVHEFKTVNSKGETVWVQLRVTPLKDKNGNVTAALELAVPITERKKAERAIEESEEKYKNLFENAPDVIVTVDLTGKITSVNKAIMQHGFKENGIVGNSIFKLVPIEYNRKMLTGLKNIAAGNPAQGEIEILTPNGKRSAEYSSNPIRLNGKVVGYQTMLRDVTERKKAQEALRESEEKHRKLFEESMDAILVADAATGIIVDCNPAASKLVGREKSELVGQHQSIIHPKEQIEGKFSRGFKQHLKDQTTTLETQIMLKTGEVRDVAVKGTIFELNGKKLIQGIFRDITERKLMQQALQENEEKFHGIANSVKDALILVDEKTKVTYWNPAAEKTFGYRSEETIGKDIHELVVPNTICKEGKERISSSVTMFTETGTGYFTFGNVELVGRRKDGTEFPAELSISPIKLRGKWNAAGVVKDITDRKKAEQKLREAEQRYHALFNEAPLGVLVIDPQTEKPVEFNDVAHTQLGYSREEFSKLRISDFEAKEKAEETNAHIARMVREGGGEFETKHRTKNGEIRDVLVTIRVVELADKMFLHCIFHDITEIRKAQDALMKSESQYRQLVNAAQEGIWALDSNYRTVFVNPRMTQMLGCAESEMVGKSLFDFLDARIVEKAKRFLGQDQQGMVGQFEYEFLRQDGTRIYTGISASQITDDDGKFVGTLALVADVTERERAEVSLKNSEEKFRNLAEQSPNIIFINQKGKVVYANTEAEEATGYKKEEFYSPKFNFMDLIAPESKEFVKSQFIKHMKGEDVHQYEYKLISKKGQTIDVINNSKVINYNGEPAIIGIVTDITESKRLKEKLEQYSMHLESLVKERTVQLEQAQAQLVKSERLAAIGELAGMVGHDLRNPLTGIKNAAYYLKKKGATCPEGQAKEMLETIDKCVDYSNKIVNDLLDYSREIRLELQECSLRKLLSEALAMMNMPEKVEILNHLPDELDLKADSDKIKRVFINLIKNAVDAMPNGGKITIDSKEVNGSLEISFADTGIGISDEVLPKLFSPLFTTKAQGMGFGLAICKRLIETHGGKITVKTAKGKGTTFTVTLPIEPKLEIGGEKIWINMPKSSLSMMTKT
jgi:PAS domain S-box-containing protein